MVLALGKPLFLEYAKNHTVIQLFGNRIRTFTSDSAKCNTKKTSSQVNTKFFMIKCFQREVKSWDKL